MSLEQKDLELVERIIYKHGDDVAIAIGRSFERLEERIDAAETRLYSRLADIEECVDDNSQNVTDIFEAVREDIRELSKIDGE
jgi:hypothetical protein